MGRCPKKSLEHTPSERLRWRVLRAFRALPTEERVGRMRQRDYLWCALNLVLDEEERLAMLCPSCRTEAERERCPACGRETGALVREENPAFDLERFLELQGGETP